MSEAVDTWTAENSPRRRRRNLLGDDGPHQGGEAVRPDFELRGTGIGDCGSDAFITRHQNFQPRIQ